MVTEIIIGCIVQDIYSRVTSLIADKISLAWNLSDAIEGLKESLAMIRAVLKDYEKQYLEKEHVKLWINKLKEVALEIENVLDELTFRNSQEKVSKSNPFSKFARNVIFRREVAYKVKNINELLAMINNEAVSFGVHSWSVDRTMSNIDSSRLTDSVLENPIVGRDFDVEKIINLLNDSGAKELLTILPIVGAEGIGKTALAKLVCHQVIDRRIFDVKLWVCVTNNFSDQNILEEMLQILNRNVNLINKDAILYPIKKELKEKRFILVIDNLHGDVLEQFEYLKKRLLSICGKNGNAIIVTTRSNEVASMVQSSSKCRHLLERLFDDQCWLIIKERACKNGKISIPRDFDVIGKAIARSCNGIPLAAKVLGDNFDFEREKEKLLLTKSSKL